MTPRAHGINRPYGPLRWLTTVTSIFEHFEGYYNHSLSDDATHTIYKKLPIVIVCIFVDTIGYHSNSMTTYNGNTFLEEGQTEVFYLSCSVSLDNKMKVGQFSPVIF